MERLRLRLGFVAFLLAAALGVPEVGRAQTAEAPQPRAEVPRAEAPRTTPNRPRPRPTNPRDRAFLDGGAPSRSGFSGFAGPRAPAPQAQLAPRPNVDLEYRPSFVDPPNVATISPTLINPALPGRGAAAHGAVQQREQRFLENPAAGARFSVPMTW